MIAKTGQFMLATGAAELAIRPHAASLSAGPPDESSQTFTFSLTTNNDALFAALSELVTTYGEDATAKYAEGLSARIRNGEFSIPQSRQ